MSELVPTDDGPGRLLQTITDLARDPSFDVAKFKALAELQLTMEDRQAERLLTRDLQEAQRRIPPVLKNGMIPKGQKNGKDQFVPFAQFEDVMAAVQPMCDEFGFTISFTTRFESTKIVVTTVLRHRAGAQITADVPLPIDEGAGRNLTQSHGSSLSYGKRMGVESLFNIIRKGKDDDGSTADLRYISGEQCREIEDLIQKSGRSRDSVLTWAGVRDVTEIEVQNFTRTKNALLKAVGQKEAAP